MQRRLHQTRQSLLIFSMFWKQAFYRVLGITAVCGGASAFYDYGTRILPIFERFVGGSYDAFEVFNVFSSFFLGALALVWVGVRLLTLRSFSDVLLYHAAFPLTSWLQEFYDLGLIFKMDRVLSLAVVYGALYLCVVYLMRFTHRRWYAPISHEDMRHVSLEEPERPPRVRLKWVLCASIFWGLLVLHPADIGTTLRMLMSPIGYVIDLLR
jgi:hypothetical protein